MDLGYLNILGDMPQCVTTSLNGYPRGDMRSDGDGETIVCTVCVKDALAGPVSSKLHIRSRPTTID